MKWDDQLRYKVSYYNIIFILFFAGIIGGTVLANCLNKELMEQSGYFGTLFSANSIVNWKEQRNFFLYVLKQRSIEVVIGWLISMSVFSATCFAGLAFAFGAMIGIVISMITYQKGVWGIFYYIATIFPQAICYIPVWGVLAVWAAENGKPHRIVSIIKLLLLVVVGALLEAFINPHLLIYLLK